MDLDELRSKWHRATERDRPQDAVKALVELERLEPHEPRWSQRLGEAHRRAGQTKEAVDAFARAFQRYFAAGFLPRAIAMAKLVGSLDAARGDLLEQSLPRAGSRTVPLAAVKPPPVVTPPKPAPTKAAPPPPPPPPPRQPTPLPKVVKPVPLHRAADAAANEVRFRDEPEASVELNLADFAAVEVVTIDVEAPASLAEPPPPSAGPDNYETMASFRLFAALSRDALVALANAAELVEFVPGAMVVVRDERAFALYAIVSGIAKVVVKGSEIRLHDGDVFGEGCLLDEGKRQADVRAESPLMTLRIDKRALDAVTKDHPEVEDVLFDLLARRLLMNLMHTSPLFTSFEPETRLELAQKFEVRRAEPGTVIAEQGRRSDGLYILLAGNVIAEPEGAEPTRVARGTAFGHASLVGAGTANVTVRAATEAVLLRMPAAGFASLAAAYPPALAHLAEIASEPLPASEREP